MDAELDALLIDTAAAGGHLGVVHALLKAGAVVYARGGAPLGGAAAR